MELTRSEKIALLKTARESLQSIYSEIIPAKPDYKLNPNLELNAGAFVTLSIDKNLRGCIGYVYSPMNLFQTVGEAALQAAKNDPRFYPVTEAEIDIIDIEISILTPPVKIKNIDEINIGVHGLLLLDDEVKSILLPQVAVKSGFSVEQFLEALCEKAGYSKDAWKSKFQNINIFSAIIFSEIEMRGISYEQN
jgi:uncharacterized protein